MIFINPASGTLDLSMGYTWPINEKFGLHALHNVHVMDVK